MKIYETFQHFWNEFSATKPNVHGFNDQILVSHLHTNDVSYMTQRQDGTDALGFQPLLLIFANPMTKTTTKYLVKNVDDNLAASFLHYCRKQYSEQFPSLFGSFRPDEFHAFAEYDNWESFYKNWFEHKGVSVLDRHLPLLFDHTPMIEYWTRKQTGLEVLPYQRLLVTTFFAPKNQFFDFFIKDVDDAEIERIKLLTQSRLGFNLEKVYSRGGA